MSISSGVPTAYSIADLPPVSRDRGPLIKAAPMKLTGISFYTIPRPGQRTVRCLRFYHSFYSIRAIILLFPFYGILITWSILRFPDQFVSIDTNFYKSVCLKKISQLLLLLHSGINFSPMFCNWFVIRSVLIISRLRNAARFKEILNSFLVLISP